MLTVVGVLTLVIMLAGVGLLAGLGRWWQPVSQAGAASQDERRPAVAKDDTDARAVVDALMGATEELAATPSGPVGPAGRDAVLDRCPTSAPMLGAERAVPAQGGQLSVAATVYGAGLGQRALEERAWAVGRCGGTVALVPSPGVAAFEASAADRWAVTWRRGDVLVRVLASGAVDPAIARDLATRLDARLQDLLTDRCADPAAPADAARRNPGQPDHQGLVVAEPVTPPADQPPPDLGLLDGPLPSPDGDALRQAASLTQAPPPPVPADPWTLLLPIADTTGPGCGWTFTGMIPPDDPDAVAADADRIRQEATQQLADRWAAWPGEVDAWKRLKAAYYAVLAQRARSTTTQPAPPTTEAPTTTEAPATTAPPTTAPRPTTTSPPPTKPPKTTTTTSPPTASPPTTAASGGSATSG